MGEILLYFTSALLTCMTIAVSDTPEYIEGLEIPASTADVQFIQHIGYSLGFVPEYKQAAWVAYTLSRCEIQCQEVPKRKDYFRLTRWSMIKFRQTHLEHHTIEDTLLRQNSAIESSSFSPSNTNRIYSTALNILRVRA
jgi:hypothetical protein